ncbi:MAG: polysaccharide biosynthesis C-terminal domain-containing protein, partial [Gemmatimonadota bacterium]|nr:polysaccharide biosynthesis C-terminal domain-containing protein [Gemmatimonadota bacterium]
IFTQALNLVLIYLFLTLGYGIAGLLWATIIPAAVSLAVLYYASADNLKYPSSPQDRGEPLDMKPVRSYSYTMWSQNLIGYLLGKQTDITLMGLFKTSLASVGCYNIAFELTNKIGFFLTGAGLLTLSSISEKYTASGKEGLRSIWTHLFKIFALATFPIMFFTAANCKGIITALYTAEMAESIPMFYLFVAVMAITTMIGAGLSRMCLYVLQMQKTYLKIAAFSGILNLLLDLALIPRMGAFGAVLATTASTLTGNILTGIIFWRTVGFSYPAGFILRLVPGLALAVSPTMLIETDRLRFLALEGILFFLCTIVIFRFLKLFSDQEKTRIAEINPMLGKVVSFF